MLKRVRVAGSRFRAGVRFTALASAIGIGSLGWSGLALALGLGDIRLNSALNQPLDAQIELVETAGLDPEDIIVKLASPEAFAKAGVERAFFLNDLRFTPVIRGNTGYIEVVSNKPVVEPYLSFLVQVSRPNGDLLHEYTVLLDPATSPEGQAATRGRTQRQQQAAAVESRMPVAPPMAVQGKHYTVVAGDTLASIARRVQGPGERGSAAQVAEAIQALNPLAFPKGPGSALRAGQNLLLPDAAQPPAVQPPEPAASEAAAAAEAEAQKAVQLAAAAIETQQLDDLKTLNRSLQEQLFERDKAVTELRAQLTELRDAGKPPVPAATTAPAPAAAPVAAAAPAPVASSEESSWFSLPLLIAAAVVLLAVLLVLRMRQRRQQAEVEPAEREEPLLKPAQPITLPVYEVPAVVSPVAAAPAASSPVPTPASATTLSKAPAAQRPAGTAPDALDGVSIYIAYGRFNEALAILRDASHKQPEREDIRERILELLADQGDAQGFAAEESAALGQGMSAERIQAIRARHPQLEKAAHSGAAPTVAAAAGIVAGAGLAGAAASEPQPSPASVPAEPAQLDETAAAALNPEHEDAFQLNLDELSLDADWDLVDPFDKPVPVSKAEVPPAAAADPNFASNLTELPEVFELQDEQFLSDLSLPEDEAEESIELIEPVEPSGLDTAFSVSGVDLLDGLGDLGEVPDMQVEAIELAEPVVDNEALDEAFLDSFADDEGMEFDLLELDEEPLTQINQAQLMIDEGDIDGARLLLQEVLDGADEAHRKMAEDLLSSLD